MDPFSLAVSIAGLISLAFQVAKLATRVNDTIKVYVSSGKDVERLSRTLSRIYSACSGVRSGLEKRQQYQTGRDGDARNSDTLDHINTALAKCYSTLSALEDEVSSLATPTQHAMTKWKASLRLRRAKIEELEKELNEWISHIEFLVIADIW